MTTTSTVTKNTITLRGSASIVADFFGYSINSILYQRGIYEQESFTRVQKYGLAMQVTTDVQLQQYIKNVMTQLQGEWNSRQK